MKEHSLWCFMEQEKQLGFSCRLLESLFLLPFWTFRDKQTISALCSLYCLFHQRIPEHFKIKLTNSGIASLR